MIFVPLQGYRFAAGIVTSRPSSWQQWTQRVSSLQDYVLISEALSQLDSSSNSALEGLERILSPYPTVLPAHPSVCSLDMVCIPQEAL